VAHKSHARFREIAEGAVIALAIFAGAALLWNQISPWLLRPTPPIWTENKRQMVFRTPGGLLIERFSFDAHVLEICGVQTFVRTLYDPAEDQARGPKVVEAIGPVTRFFTYWIPVGDYSDLMIDVEIEPGRIGTLHLSVQLDSCPSGFKGAVPIYSFQIDWSHERLAALGLIPRP
jgi:hypothetical protein